MNSGGEYEVVLSFLKRAGFAILRHEESPQAFGNEHWELSKGNFALRVTRDRGQIFLEVYCSNLGWVHYLDLINAGRRRDKLQPIEGDESVFEVEPKLHNLLLSLEKLIATSGLEPFVMAIQTERVASIFRRDAAQE